jgi:hypothetical protein
VHPVTTRIGVLGLPGAEKAQDGHVIRPRQVEVEHPQVEIQFPCRGADLFPVGRYVHRVVLGLQAFFRKLPSAASSSATRIRIRSI